MIFVELRGLLAIHRRVVWKHEKIEMLPFRFALSFVALVLSGVIRPANAETGQLASIDAGLQRSYPEIGHLSTSQLAAWTRQAKDVVLVDVRREDEFLVGHISGAIRISPGASPREVAARLREAASGKAVVFYCSVGVRSSRLADRSKSHLEELGATGIYNLSGGIFTWHDEARPLVGASGPTLLVHPYDSAGGRLLSRQAYVSRVPDNARAE